MFNPLGDFIEEMSDHINRLFDEMTDEEGGMIPRRERCDIVQELTDEYVADTKERPISDHLDRLASYILRVDRSGARWADMLTDEYPFLSDRQYRARLDREASLIHAGTFDSLGFNRAVQTRTSRIQLELKTKKVK